MTDLDELSRLLEQLKSPAAARMSIQELAYLNDQKNVALTAAAEALIRDARACAEIRRVIAAGKDDGSVGRVARRAIAQEQP